MTTNGRTRAASATASMAAEQAARLREIFPQCVTETKNYDWHLHSRLKPARISDPPPPRVIFLLTGRLDAGKL